ncbi:MAG: arylesterase [Pseudomonadota bacterium]
MACTAADETPAVLVLGDSLSAGYGLDISEGWVTLLKNKLAEEGYGHDVVNASISGDTTSGGRSRLKKALTRHAPALVIIELGGNDGLRGQPVRAMRRNLEAMIKDSRAAGAQVALLGMRIPPNYGERYANAFHAVYGDLAETHDLPLVTFFLEGVALDKALMQADGIHPNAKAQPILLDNAWPVVTEGLRAWCDAVTS